MVTHGAKGGLLALLAALVEPGDEVIHPLPCYPAYPAMVRRLGGVPMGVAEHGDGFAGWSASVPGDRRTENPRGRALIAVESFGNDHCRQGVDGARRWVPRSRDQTHPRRGVLGVLLWRRRGRSGRCRRRIIVVRVGSASKSLALPGWRMGWIVADEELVSRVTSVQSALLNPPATPPQQAMLALPEVPDSYFEANRRAVSERLDAMAKAVQRAGFDALMPAGGFYLWVDIRDRLDPKNPDSAAWCESLAEEHGVGLWPGEDYGTPGFVRLALPQGDTWHEVVQKLEERLSAAD